MPEPKEYDDEKEWMKVCVPKLIKEGREQDQAVAVCMNMWKHKDDAPEKAVKVAGDWELDVLGVPFGSPADLDADGQYFDPKTALHQDKYPTIPAVYFHGRDPNGKPINPEYVGKATPLRVDERGAWYRVVLDKTKQLAARVWQAAKDGIARASSGSAPHLVRTNGAHIAEWPVIELSVFDMGGGRVPANRYAVALPTMKSHYLQAGISLPDITDETESETAANGGEGTPESTKQEKQMDTEKKVEGLSLEDVEARISAALKAQELKNEAAQKAAQERQAEIDAEVKKQVEAIKAEAVAGRRLPMGEAPYQAKFADTWKYDGVEPADHALVIDILRSQGKSVPAASLKSLAFKVSELKDDNTKEGREGVQYVKSAFRNSNGYEPTVDAIKAVTDPMLTTGTTDGGNWVYALYSNELWRSIRADNAIVSKIPSVQIPDGYSSEYFPIEGTDPTWYKVAEVTTSANPAPDATITASQITTPTKRQLTVAKMGARTLYSGELLEDSMIPFAAQLREQLAISGAEALEHVVIDGDTTATVANINDTNSGGGGAAGTEIFCLFDGLRHLGLVTNTDNKRAGGALDEDDYLETMWLMGTAGLAGADLAKCAFIVDPNVYKKSLMMATVKTKDVWTNATMESGVLTKLWGYSVFPSWNMHKNSTARKCNSDGEIDIDTTTNNLYGAILGVRWDQWKLGYKRRMTIETTRFANSDSWEIVALARVGMTYRDTDAASITYGLTV